MTEPFDLTQKFLISTVGEMTFAWRVAAFTVILALYELGSNSTTPDNPYTGAGKLVTGSGHTVFAQKTPATFAAGQCSKMIRLHARKWLPVVRTSSTNKT